MDPLIQLDLLDPLKETTTQGTKYSQNWNFNYLKDFL